MKFISSNKWAAWAIQEEVHRYFYLRWEELFSEYTLDSWQVRTCNIRSILREMLGIIDVSATHPRHFSNMEFLIAEMALQAKKDPVVVHDFPFVANMVKSIKNLYEQNKEATRKTLDTLRRAIAFTLGNTVAYKATAQARLRGLVLHPSPQYKIDLDNTIMSVAVELVSEGYSTPFLHGALKVLTQTPDECFATRLGGFLSMFSGERHAYDCRFPLILSHAKRLPTRIEGQSIRLLKETPAELEPESDEERFYKQCNEAIVAEVDVEALDPTSARNAATENVDRLLALIRLYAVRGTAEFKGSLCLVTPRDGTPFLVKPDRSRLSYVRNARGIHRRLSTLVGLIQKTAARDIGCLLSSLQYHKLALTASSDEARLINLWIAMESLVGRCVGPSINRICSVVAPSLAGGYLRKLVTTLAMDLKLPLARAFSEESSAPIEAYLTAPIVDSRRLLRLLLAEPTSGGFKALLALAKDDPLLVFRIDRLRSNFLAGPTKLAAAIVRHQRNVDWQLRRIYRARNGIVHDGKRPSALRHIVQHLHTYLVLTIHNAIHDLKDNPEWDLEVAFEHRCRLLEEMLGQLKTDGHCTLSVDALLDPSLCLLPQTDSAAWPDLTASEGTESGLGVRRAQEGSRSAARGGLIQDGAEDHA